MQLAIIGSKEEIMEVMRYIEGMRVIQKGEQVVRAEVVTRTEERLQLRFEDIPSNTTKTG
ncbi:hypothetical protein OE059_04870 [Exiguobacterium profundum]|uniref:Uncharacterized protein n=1 Tax=Exiguobacterium profundum TaxID=307643 RepID=A0ABY8B6N1_9BACL|nr:MULTISPECIES: hypothetical protein [Exiguobacterium]WED56194.1 hypothetical protein OE059_04870 [Exiguobacterium profundum]